MKRLTLEEIKIYFLNEDCILLDDKYENAKVKMRYIAMCGHEHEVSYDNFKNGKGRLCPSCAFEEKGKRKRLKEDEVKERYRNIGCELLDTYIDSQTKSKYIAQCGHVHYAR